MENNLLQEISVSFILIILLILLLNPFGFWMPTQLVMMLVFSLIIIFVVFTSFIWKENAKDERESFHRMMAGRIAFLSGAGVLVIGIIVQSLSHNLDPWLVFTLGLMILAKIGGLIYSRINH